MVQKDIDDVASIESTSTLDPWSKNLFEKEINGNEFSRFFVYEEDSKIVGYGGYWLIGNEITIVNIAVSMDKRRNGIGKVILKHLIVSGKAEGAVLATLSKRVQ
jgi:ribosomal-protein-alanine N-acetyltransferase